VRLRGRELAASLVTWSPEAPARVTRIVVDTRVTPAFPFNEGGGHQAFGAAGLYETIAGHAFGELDPADPRNAIIQDIALAPRNANGKVEYVASFYLVKPVDMAKASGLLWHKRAIRMLVPKVDADGNEVGGVPVVLRDAPLGTYLGWNITGGGTRPFHQGQICNYMGGMIPFARTQAERVSGNDPRLSLEERYLNHAGYVKAVRAAAENAVRQGFLLQADADALIRNAAQSNVLKGDD